MEGHPQEEPQPMPMQYDQQPPPVYMEQPKPALPNLQGIQQLIAGMNIQVFKEPRGFMKILQFIFGISAFATTTSFVTSFAFTIQCQKAENKQISISNEITYPFEIDSIRPSYPVCDGGQEQRLFMEGDFSSDSQFFVAVGVLAFLYVIAALVLYCVFFAIYENNPLAPLADCAVHVFFAIMWLAASSAWANSLTALRQATDINTIIDENKQMCDGYTCDPTKNPNYSKLIISVILGFLNTFLWGSNLWFLYKETHFFKGRTMDTQNAAQPNIPVP